MTMPMSKAAEAHSHPDNHSYHDDDNEQRHLRVYDRPFLPVYHRKYADSSPIALFALAGSLLTISIVALGADGLSNLSISIAVALGFSSIALLVAGIWEFPQGNTFAATLWLTFSGFFASLALILAPWSGVASAYTSTTEFSHAFGIWFFQFFIASVLLTVAAHRSSGGLICFLTLVDFTLLFLGLSYYKVTNTHFITAGGSFGIIASFVAYYAAFASLLTKESSLFRLPVLLDLTPKSA